MPKSVTDRLLRQHLHVNIFIFLKFQTKGVCSPGGLPGAFRGPGALESDAERRRIAVQFFPDSSKKLRIHPSGLRSAKVGKSLMWAMDVKNLVCRTESLGAAS